jgi:class 3 adenylate cyclase
MFRSIPVGGDGAGERRHAAVLFADLSGFTALVESTTPEDVYALVRPLMDELVLLVRDHCGDIQQVLGDGFMSVFGLGPGSGNEAGCAVEAAVALVGAAAGWGRLPVHVGIECGEVLVSPSWEPARFAVWGRTVTVAKRLCDLAGPSTIHIGPHAYANGGGAVLASVGVSAARAVLTGLKGIAGEIPAYRVTDVVERPRILAGCA